MDLRTFLDRLLGPEFVYTMIRDLENDTTICRGFVDDLLKGSISVIQKYDVVTWYILNHCERDELFINVRKKEK